MAPVSRAYSLKKSNEEREMRVSEIVPKKGTQIKIFDPRIHRSLLFFGFDDSSHLSEVGIA